MPEVTDKTSGGEERRLRLDNLQALVNEWKQSGSGEGAEVDPVVCKFSVGSLKFILEKKGRF